MRWASAVSDAPSLDAALASASEQVRAEMQGELIDLALIFLSHHYAWRYAQVPMLLHRHLQCRLLAGCSAGGVIGGGREIEQRPGVALTVASLPEVAVQPVALQATSLPDLDASPGAWHAALGVPAEPQPHFVLLADASSFPVQTFLSGLDYAYPRSTKVGGLASATNRPGANVLYLGTRALRSGAIGIAFTGDVHLDAVVSQGCRPLGKRLQVTRCQENVLLGLDGKPPLEVIQALVAELSEADRELASQALFLGVAVGEPTAEQGTGDFLLHDLLGADPERGALTVSEPLRLGQMVQFHVRDALASAMDLESTLGRFAAGSRARQARGALLFSCLGRGVCLYGRPDQDTSIFRNHLRDVPLGGFFCSGEIGPAGGGTHVHGFTSSFGIFRPASAS